MPRETGGSVNVENTSLQRFVRAFSLIDELLQAPDEWLRTVAPAPPSVQSQWAERDSGDLDDLGGSQVAKVVAVVSSFGLYLNSGRRGCRHASSELYLCMVVPLLFDEAEAEAEHTLMRAPDININKSMNMTARHAHAREHTHANVPTRVQTSTHEERSVFTHAQAPGRTHVPSVDWILQCLVRPGFRPTWHVVQMRTERLEMQHHLAVL